MSCQHLATFKVFALRIADLFKILCELFRVKLHFLFYNFKINYSKYAEINVELSNNLLYFFKYPTIYYYFELSIIYNDLCVIEIKNG